MAEITLKGNACNTCGDLPAVGAAAPEFTLVGGDLGDANLGSFAGKKVIISTMPSFDTPVCALSVKAFNEKVGGLENTVIVNVSKDLPFAQKRFCESNQLEHVTNLSAFRCDGFGNSYGVSIIDGPLKGLLARSIVVLDTEGKVAYTELIPEIAQEPNYDAAIAAAS